MVGFRGQWFPMEIKDGSAFSSTFRRLTRQEDKNIFLRGTLTKGERKFYDDCQALGLPYIIAYSVDSAIRGIGAHKPNFEKKWFTAYKEKLPIFYSTQ